MKKEEEEDEVAGMVMGNNHVINTEDEDEVVGMVMRKKMGKKIM